MRSKIQSCLRHRQAMSLVELLIVLGISTMLIASSMAWFSSQKNSDFYDQMRQVESQIRKIQSDAATNIVPGYDAGSAACNTYPRANTCVLQTDEQVFGSAIAVQKIAGSLNDTIKIYYLKSTAPNATTKRSESITPFGPGSNPVAITRYSDSIRLPNNVRYYGYRVYLPTPQVDGSYKCLVNTTDTTWDAGKVSWDNLAANSRFREVSTSSPTAALSYSAMVLRRQPNSYYTFWDSSSAATIYDVNSIDPPFKQPLTPPTVDPRMTPADTLTSVAKGSVNGGYYAEYDKSYIPPSAATQQAPLKSQPCAVVWRFGTVDQIGGKPRLSAELVFDIQGASMRLKTR